MLFLTTIIDLEILRVKIQLIFVVLVRSSILIHIFHSTLLDLFQFSDSWGKIVVAGSKKSWLC